MTNLQAEYKRKDTFWHKWTAVIILIVFFIFSWGGQFVTQLSAAKNESAQHNQEFQMSEFWPEFWSATFENWQSEWLQLIMQALFITALADYIFRKGNQDHYKTQLMIDELKQEIRQSKSR